MSLVEITRNCFQSGIPAAKWLSLCKLFVSKNEVLNQTDNVEVGLSSEYSHPGMISLGSWALILDSVLVLYQFYPGNPDLQAYLKHAIQSKYLSIASFVATLLQAARSPDLHQPATLDMLCRTALDAHYSSGMPPIGSVIPFSYTQEQVLALIVDALAMLRTAHALPMSHFHQPTSSAAQLVILLLSCMTDVSQISTSQAMMLFADVNDILQTCELESETRQMLEQVVLSLSIIIGDDSKAAREAQMMFAIGKGDILGPNSENDIVTLGLFLNHAIYRRCTRFGVGNDQHFVAQLLATYRWTLWTPTIFYTQLFLSAMLALTQSSLSNTFVWRAFLVGRLPNVLPSFERLATSDTTSERDWRSAMRAAMSAVFRRVDITTACDMKLLSYSSSLTENNPDVESKPVTRELLQRLLATQLLDQRGALELDPLLSNGSGRTLETEAQEVSIGVEEYIERKLTSDLTLTSAAPWLNNVFRDASCHAAFASAVAERFSRLSSAMDSEGLSSLCKVLYTFDPVLDIISLYKSISDIMAQSYAFLSRYDQESVGDPQTVTSQLGDVVLCMQSILSRFHLDKRDGPEDEIQKASVIFREVDRVHKLEDMKEDEQTSFKTWFKVLFDSSSEGIGDTILRTTAPQVLLRLAPSLFSHAIAANRAGKLDAEGLNNGVSYFNGPLLNWTLVGVVKIILKEIEQDPSINRPHLEILQSLLLSSSCPKPVVALCAPKILQIVARKNIKDQMPTTTFDRAIIEQAVTKVIGVAETSNIQHTIALKPPSTPVPFGRYPKSTIQTCLMASRNRKTSFIDIHQCLLILSPTRFLQLLWTELMLGATMPGNMEICRRLATYILVQPDSKPPLLPIFMHGLVPSLLSFIDTQEPAEQTVSVELLMTIISSSLTAALHLELALSSSEALGQASSAIARRLALELRSRRSSQTGKIILKRLSSSQSFVTNFPVFMGGGGSTKAASQGNLEELSK